MLRRNGGAQLVVGRLDVLRGFARRDVLKDDLEFRISFAQRLHYAVDKARLAIENIDVGVGHFAMNQQRHADLLHALQHAADGGDVGNAVA